MVEKLITSGYVVMTESHPNGKNPVFVLWFTFSHTRTGCIDKMANRPENQKKRLEGLEKKIWI